MTSEAQRLDNFCCPMHQLCTISQFMVNPDLMFQYAQCSIRFCYASATFPYSYVDSVLLCDMTDEVPKSLAAIWIYSMPTDFVSWWPRIKTNSRVYVCLSKQAPPSYATTYLRCIKTSATVSGQLHADGCFKHSGSRCETMDVKPLTA